MSSATSGPMAANLQLVYVSDVERSTTFYKSLFKTDPIFITPRYVAFRASSSGDALFALWSGGETPDLQVQRFNEIGIMLPTSDDVEQLFQEWQGNSDIEIVKELYTEVFGRTFLVKDPDGHIIRVCPLD
ncbi:VOC family protein [Xenorhabdus szentirmaii]|uniref:Phenazine antibiotic resistance protein n=1 Tax=Xenorhabdus szentirmaii DSM 16338 TaxID=1427518 RepID=W1IQN3_9GAMM|nr:MULTISPECIES: VOC family protein [Xenorhabdus]MBD2779171.1 VOC family protein [Xenorhabdus sp. 38]MBD2792622.1 VOC family protein [Xenorhabdus sp. CUL]MBD2805801.1 VOC family protein [Xenorhabdus sp. ZM]MBD2821351.1 VOC family protein [Xenorhabdus sp. 42]MBD2826675.1 VOC family protein [Xenorhabdus sp. 5]